MATAKIRPARTAPSVSKSVGTPEQKSRAKADASTKRAQATTVAEPASIPTAPDGYPLVKIAIAAAELIPTGQFANISVGPATIEWYVDPREEDPISSAELENAAKALNQLAELVEIDVIAVQRNLVLESMQSQVAETAAAKS
jgi:hypothetical protein